MSELETYFINKDKQKSKNRAKNFETSPYLKGTSEQYRNNYDKIDWSKKTDQKTE